MRHTQQHKAFSIMESMLVITIIGILVGLGLPAVERFLIRSKIQSAVALGVAVINKAETEFALNDTMPTDIENYKNGQNVTNVSPDVNFIRWDRISATEGQITITMADNVRIESTNTSPNTIWLRVRSGAGRSFQRACGPRSATEGIEEKYLPQGCRTSINGW